MGRGRALDPFAELGAIGLAAARKNREWTLFGKSAVDQRTFRRNLQAFYQETGFANQDGGAIRASASAEQVHRQGAIAATWAEPADLALMPRLPCQLSFRHGRKPDLGNPPPWDLEAFDAVGTN